jgi:hypothetical protein
MVKVIKNEEKPETKEILAEAIVNIGKAVGRLKDNKLNRRGIVVLLQDATHYPKRTIGIFLMRYRGLKDGIVNNNFGAVELESSGKKILWLTAFALKSLCKR